MSAAHTILATLVLYVVGLVAAGLIARRRAAATDFLVGGRDLGPWVAALSASASSASAWSLLGVSGAAYRYGLGAAWLFPACVGGFLINWWLVAPRVRRIAADEDAHTLIDVIAGGRRDAGARRIARVGAIIVLVSLLGYVAAQFQGAGKTFGAGFGLDMRSGVLLGTTVILAYTLVGGIVAVNMTDAVQGAVMLVAAVILPIGALVAVGGPFELWTKMHAVAIPGFSDPLRALPLPLGIAFVLGLLGIGLGYPGQPHVVNRLMAVRDERALRQARRIAVGWAVILFGGMIVVGWSARVILPDLADPEVALMAVTRELFPPVIEGLTMAAVLSAAVSTADSQLLVAASAIGHDLRHGEASSGGVGHSRVVITALAVAATLAAMVGTDEIFSRVLFSWAAMGAAFGPALLVRLHGRRPSTEVVLAAMLVGFSTSIAAGIFAPRDWVGLFERVVPFVLALAVLLVGQPRSER